ncbi:MAG: ATP synthase F0 subunit C [Bdellovibrionota bacterium]
MKRNKLVALSTFALPLLAVAEEATATTVATANSGVGLGYLAAGLGIGIACAVVGYSQSRAASAALDGIARNPASAKPIFVPLLLSLALMEALVLFAFLITSTLASK